MGKKFAGEDTAASQKKRDVEVKLAINFSMVMGKLAIESSPSARYTYSNRNTILRQSFVQLHVPIRFSRHALKFSPYISSLISYSG